MGCRHRPSPNKVVSGVPCEFVRFGALSVPWFVLGSVSQDIDIHEAAARAEALKGQLAGALAARMLTIAQRTKKV